MKYSIVIVTSNRHKELFNCLNSILRSPSSYDFEVIVIFNGDRSYLEKCVQTFKRFSMHFVHKTTPANARNFGTRKAHGEYILYLDDDCILPKDYFKKISFDSGWDVLGGPDQTPPSSSNLQKAIGKTLSSPLCMGLTYKRHTQSGSYLKQTSENSLILCNLWFKTSLFHQENFQFNPDLYRNEENFLLKELKNNGKNLHYNPELFVYHQRKENLEKLGTAIIKSGECRIQNISMLPNKNESLYLLPLFWFGSLFYVIFHPQSFLTNLFLAYTFLIILYYGIKHRGFSLRFIVLHYFILAAYSIGLMRGLWKFLPIFYSNLRENKSLINESSNK